MPNPQLDEYRTAAAAAGWDSEDRRTNRPIITSYRLTRPDSALVIDVIPDSGALDSPGFRIRYLRRTATGTTRALDVRPLGIASMLAVLEDPAKTLAGASDAVD